MNKEDDIFIDVHKGFSANGNMWFEKVIEKDEKIMELNHELRGLRTMLRVRDRNEIELKKQLERYVALENFDYEMLKCLNNEIEGGEK